MCLSASFDQGADSSLDRQTQTLRRPAHRTAVLATFTQTQTPVSAVHTGTQQLLTVDLDAVISHSRSQIPLHAPSLHLTGSWGHLTDLLCSRNSTDALVNTLSHTHSHTHRLIYVHQHQRPPTQACKGIYTFPLAASVLSVGIHLLQQYFTCV